MDGYTYKNIIEEGTHETSNTVNKGEETANDDLVDEDNSAEASSKVDEESLIRQKSPYEQKFISAHRSLFSRNPQTFKVLAFPSNENETKTGNFL